SYVLHASVPSDRVGKPLIGLISVLGWLETPSPCLSWSLHQGSCRYTAFGMVSNAVPRLFLCTRIPSETPDECSCWYSAHCSLPFLKGKGVLPPSSPKHAFSCS